MIQILDDKPGLHIAIAVKPKSSNPLDAKLLIVLHKSVSSGCPYVVHDMNLETGGYHNGRYCQTLEEGLTIFNKAD
jgi:hypothetical protein